MSATGSLSDDVIEAIVDDRPVDPSGTALATFARHVRALGEGAAPRPSSELAALLAGSTTLDAHLATTAPLPVVAAADRPAPPTEPTALIDVSGAHRSNGANGSVRSGRSVDPTRSTPSTPSTERLAALGAGGEGRRRVAKIALGVSLAVGGVAGAGAVGILPAAANDAVRSAIEAVSPVHFSDAGGGDAPAADDDRMSESPTTDEDGTSEGTTIADDAEGADHRPGPNVADEPPGQSGDTGLTRANETPAEPHAPDTTPAATAPSTVPVHGPPAEAGQAASGSDSVPSTVPARGDSTDDHGSDT